MKKTVIAVGVIIAIEAIWTGSTWYTGQKVETELAQLTKEANKALQRSGIILKLDSVKRSFFSSEAQMSMQIPISGEEDIVIPFIDKIEHGPFPVSRLKSFKLMPKMLVAHTILGKNTVTQPIFDTIKQGDFFTATTTIGYSGAFDTRLTFLPVDVKKEDVQLNFSGLDFTASASSLSQPISAEGSMTQLTLQDGNGNFAIKDLRFSGTQTPVSSENYQSDQIATIGKMTYNNASDDIALTLSNVGIEGHLSGDKNLYKGDILYSVEKTELLNKEFGAGKLKIAFDHLDCEAIDSYNQEVQKLFFSADMQKNAMTPDEQQQRMLELGKQTFTRLLKHSPQLKIEPLSWKNSQGESLYNLDITLQNATIDGNLDSAQQIFAFIKELKSSLSVSLPMSNELVTTLLTTQGIDSLQARQEAATRVNMMKGVLSMVPGLVAEKGDLLLNTLEYRDGQVTINDKKMPLQQFITEFLPFASGATSSGDNQDNTQPAVPEQDDSSEE